MSSNVDSDGCPIDHDGNKLEDGVFSSGARIAIRGDIFQELFSGSGQDKSEQHLESGFLEDSCVKASALGGIPIVERVEIEDVDEGLSSDDAPSPKAGVKGPEQEMSATVHAILRTSKQEREALFLTRKKLGDVLGFLRKKGFSEEQVLADLKADGFGCAQPNRDDNGLPIRIHAQNPFVDKMKEKIDGEVFVESTKPKGKSSEVPSADSEIPKVPISESSPKSWANVVKRDSPPLKLHFHSKAKGASLLEPPDEVLIKGNDKYKNYVVGTFSKGTLSFKKVSEFAFKYWKGKGLLSVHQKDNSTFMFHFNDLLGANDLLNRGTWYIERRPMILTAWGHKPGSSIITNMPLWVKFTNLPDCYWTEEGLSHVASVIGEPLGADSLTAKLEVLPFARLQVNYKLGDPLPNDIHVAVIDPITAERTTAKVLVSYPVRPIFCSGCKSLGHSISACPKISRVWKQKVKTPSEVPVNSQPPLPTVTGEAFVSNPQETPNVKSNDENDWTEVKRKKPPSSPESDYSPTPPPVFKNLRKVDEVEGKRATSSAVRPKRLTKSQKKKLKASSGVSPQPLP